MDEREGKYINPYTDYGFKRAIRTAEAKGREEGREEERMKNDRQTKENARKMKEDGMTFELIMKYTGLSAEEIAQL